ncbi:MAG TPA: hypothetical protein VN654_13055 [Vicinamibacterales bacterium]|nr:hypothetical protein [Vicinamibacterales bacterium]
MSHQNFVTTALVLLFAAATSASAQSLTPAVKGYVSINGGYQVTTNSFGHADSFEANAEQGRYQSDYTVKAGPSFDIAAGAIGWRHLGFGIGVSRFSRSTPLHLAGDVPHPFFFDRGREVSGDVGGLQRQEVAVHTQVRAMAPVGDRLQVMAFGGYSYFQLTQDVITEVTYTDEYPYDSASLKGATTTAKAGSKIGVNGGADVAFFLTRRLGLGFGAQYAGATIVLPMGSGAGTRVKVGGVQAGGGLRLRF